MPIKTKYSFVDSWFFSPSFLDVGAFDPFFLIKHLLKINLEMLIQYKRGWQLYENTG
jgi:hypothetical protein